MQCCVCIEEIKHDLHTTHCGHRFHTKCLDTWKQKNKTCPMCREDLDFGEDMFGMQDLPDIEYEKLVAFFGLNNYVRPKVSLEDGSQFFTHISPKG